MTIGKPNRFSCSTIIECICPWSQTHLPTIEWKLPGGSFVGLLCCVNITYFNPHFPSWDRTTISMTTLGYSFFKEHRGASTPLFYFISLFCPSRLHSCCPQVEFFSHFVTLNTRISDHYLISAPAKLLWTKDKNYSSVWHDYCSRDIA